MEQFCSSMLHKNTGGEETTFRQPGIIEKLPTSLAGKRLRGGISKMPRESDLLIVTCPIEPSILSLLQSSPPKPGLLNLHYLISFLLLEAFISMHCACLCKINLDKRPLFIQTLSYVRIHLSNIALFLCYPSIYSFKKY